METLQKPPKILIQRFTENPLITPEDVPWVQKQYSKKWQGVFNCGVIYNPEKKVFEMLFRGGAMHQSDLGYAWSKNGITGWEIKPYPVLRYRDKFFWRLHALGIEDPRIVKWQDYYYIFATAATLKYYLMGGRYGRLGIWRTKDFENFEWIGTPLKDQPESKNAAII